MTPLRQRMIDDLRIRNYSRCTINNYIRLVARFAQHFGRSPERLGSEHVRDYQLHLLASKTSWGVFNQTVAALRFLYRVTLKQNWPLERLPYGKKPKRLPCVLSQQEVLQFLGAITNPMHRMALTAAYAAGLRVSEVVTLRVEDIDSARMLIHVRQGKGQKDTCSRRARTSAPSRRCWVTLRCQRPRSMPMCSAGSSPPRAALWT